MRKFLTAILLFGLASSVYSQMPEIEGMPVSPDTYEGTIKYDFEGKIYKKGREKEPTLASKATVWRKGKLERKELETSLTPGKKAIQFTLKDGIYNYIPEEKMAMKQPLPPEVKPETKEAKPKEEVKLPEPKKVGEEKYDDKLCEVYSLEVTEKDEETGQDFKSQIKYWLWKEKKIALKLIITMEEKDEEGKLTTSIIENVYKNIDFKDIPDTVFALPEGTKITEMPKMPAPGVPGMMPMPPVEVPEEEPAELKEKPKEEKPKKKGFGLPKLP